MTVLLDPKRYRPPFITETDEGEWDDCLVCSILMATAAWTLGETVMGNDWRPLNRAELKRLREKLRNHLPKAKQDGALTFADARAFLAAEWPYLPPIEFYDVTRRTWPQAVAMLGDGWVGVAAGNPQDVTDPKSKLRRWTTNDRFAHVIYLDRTRSGSTETYVMDPLGHGDYDGEWVPSLQVRQFVGKDGPVVKVAMFQRGSQSSLAIAQRTAADKLRDVRSDLASARRDAAELASDLTACGVTSQGLKEKLDAAQARIAELEALPDDCRDAIAAARERLREQVLAAIGAIT